MSHHIYRTEALILGNRESGEADKWITLFTREHGLVWAKATSIRKSTSKLRFALGDYSIASVDLIQGRTGWKITTAVPITSTLYNLSSVQCAVFARACVLVQRLCRGEEENTPLYELMRSTPDQLSSVDASRLKSFEIFIIIRILFYLGYWDSDDESRTVVESSWGDEVCEHIDRVRISLVRRINQSLKESHL